MIVQKYNNNEKYVRLVGVLIIVLAAITVWNCFSVKAGTVMSPCSSYSPYNSKKVAFIITADADIVPTRTLSNYNCVNQYCSVTPTSGTYLTSSAYTATISGTNYTQWYRHYYMTGDGLTVMGWATWGNTGVSINRSRTTNARCNVISSIGNNLGDLAIHNGNCYPDSGINLAYCTLVAPHNGNQGYWYDWSVMGHTYDVSLLTGHTNLNWVDGNNYYWGCAICVWPCKAATGELISQCDCGVGYTIATN